MRSTALATTNTTVQASMIAARARLHVTTTMSASDWRQLPATCDAVKQEDKMSADGVFMRKVLVHIR